ncbi:MAG: c-type cytochrome [Thalassotalea sp.]
MYIFTNKLHKSYYKTAFISALMTLSTMSSAADIENGKSLFESTCAGCHGKNLDGGAGFNLKDEQWVHGDSSEEILANIKKGFGNAGMPAFANVYSEQQLTDIVAYILSRQEGLRNLSYKIYHITPDSPSTFNILADLKVKKSGILSNNLMDFSLPEVKDYIIEFEGDLYTDSQLASNVFGMVYKQNIEIIIDGEVMEQTSKEWLKNSWLLKKGKRNFKLRYSTAGSNPKSNKDHKLFVTDEKITQKLFALTTSGKAFLNKATVNIKAESDIVVMRKKTVNLPTRAISVGYPEKVNYAFSTKDCAVAGFWTGEMLNIGPNIEGRGRDGSVILGDWGFHAPASIAHKNVAHSQCQFIKYNRKGNPTFEYQLGEQQFSVSATPINNKTLVLSYQLTQGNNGSVAFTLPTAKNLAFKSEDGQVDGNQFTLDMKTGQQYQLTISLAE